MTQVQTRSSVYTYIVQQAPATAPSIRSQVQTTQQPFQQQEMETLINNGLKCKFANSFPGINGPLHLTLSSPFYIALFSSSISALAGGISLFFSIPKNRGLWGSLGVLLAAPIGLLGYKAQEHKNRNTIRLMRELGGNGILKMTRFE